MSILKWQQSVISDLPQGDDQAGTVRKRKIPQPKPLRKSRILIVVAPIASAHWSASPGGARDSDIFLR
ncbi:MAG TPA: hypothetical protein VGM26_06615 [Rhizomicrobium sp.]|jgi:hypothetical protein